MKRVDNHTPVDDLVKNTYSISEAFGNRRFGLYFSHKGHSGYFETLQSINEIFKIECLRNMGNGKYYAVFKMQEGGSVFSFFQNDDDGEIYLSHSVYIVPPVDESGFRGLKKGAPFSAILSIDDAMSKCFEKNMLCNCIVMEDKTYTVHLLKDTLYFITWKKNNMNHETTENVMIDTIESFSNKKLLISMNSTSDGVYDYNILPQDFPK